MLTRQWGNEAASKWRMACPGPDSWTWLGETCNPNLVPLLPEYLSWTSHGSRNLHLKSYTLRNLSTSCSQMCWNDTWQKCLMDSRNSTRLLPSSKTYFKDFLKSALRGTNSISPIKTRRFIVCSTTEYAVLISKMDFRVDMFCCAIIPAFTVIFSCFSHYNVL